MELVRSLGRSDRRAVQSKVWARETRRMCDTTAEVIDAMEGLSY